VEGFALALHASGRFLTFAGGSGPGWEAMIHRWDLLTNHLEAVALPELAAWESHRDKLGLFLRGEELYLVGPGAARVDLVGRRAQILTSAAPEEAGAHPYVYVDGAGQRLSAVPVRSSEPYEGGVILEFADEEPAWEASPPRELDSVDANAAEPASGVLGWDASARLIFTVQEGAADQEHLAALDASSPFVALRIFDAAGDLVAEDTSAESAQKELAFTPAADVPYYIVEASLLPGLAADAAVTYAITVKLATAADDSTPEDCPTVECDEGCGCSTASGGPASLGLLLALGLLLILRRRRG
jgi:MYXO-CTERM domain-containing protein